MKKGFALFSLLLLLSVATACSNGQANESSVTKSSPQQIDTESKDSIIQDETSPALNDANNLKLLSENSKLIEENSNLKAENTELNKENSRLIAENSEYKKKEEQSKAIEESLKTESEKIKPIDLGNSVEGNGFNFKLKSVSLTYKVIPDNPPDFYNYYEAKAGKIYIKIDAEIKNTSKVSLECDEIYTVTADYNDGYTYSGFAVADDHDGDFTYANITRIDPLETLGVHYLIECPEEVKNNSSAKLSLDIVLDGGNKYKYKIR